jgi:hypothetical protein
MEARTPEKLHPLWVQAHNMGDLDGMMVRCEREVCFVWTSIASLPDGTSKTFGGVATDIVRQQADGRWLLVLDNSYGVRRIP